MRGTPYAALPLLIFDALLFVGAAAALLAWRPGAIALVLGFSGLVLAHVAIGIVAYRRVMRRPWPKVEPLRDDKDDW